jgi:type IV secretory pathway protease TraF
MIFRTYSHGTMYVIEAPTGSRMRVKEGRSDELVVYEKMAGGRWVQRRLPQSVVINAARRGYLGLAIREQRSASFHPEVSLVDAAQALNRHRWTG